MPTTPNGTTYTITSGPVTGAGTVYRALADSAVGGTDLPFILYAHGAGGAANQFSTLGAWAGLRNWLIDNGWGWIESSGGGLQPWGNQASQDAYDATIAYADSVYDIGTWVVLGRSMGGAVAARLYNDHRLTDTRFAGIMVNSGVQDLVWAYDFDSNRWTDAFNSAWGVSSKAEFEIAVEGLNPVDGPASSWAGSNVLQLVGDADTTVPPAINGYAMRTMYAGQPTLDLLDVRAGGDHSSTNGSYLQVEAMTSFLATVRGDTPEPPTPASAYRQLRRLYYSGGERYVVTPRA